jgi:4-amino-4-deoxy-L-arabinose transferase-like glycosyltransferase
VRGGGLGLAALVALGALLRFSTIGLQELWLDEAVTVALLKLDVGQMLETAGLTESTPPLYYLVARTWSVPFGTGDVAVRSLSALAGTLTIPVAYAVGTKLASPRAGLVAAALTAVNPGLVWYSQEARSYALAVLLSALTLLFLARAVRDGDTRAPVWWAVCAGLAVLTHYFAGFLVAVEAIWLLAASRARRRAAGAVAAVGACCAAALVLAVDQSGQGNLDWIGAYSFEERAFDTVELFLVGPTGSRLRLAVPLLATLAVLGGALLARAEPGRRRAFALPASIAVAGAVLPTLLAAAGADYVVARNLLPLWLPAALVVAGGLAAGRPRALGNVLTALLVGASLWVVAAVTLDRTLQREAGTAALVPQPVDAETQHVLPVVAYSRGEPARASCPERYAAAGGGASLLSRGADEPLGPRFASGGPRAWKATAPAGARDRTVYVYAICVRPLESASARQAARKSGASSWR